MKIPRILRAALAVFESFGVECRPCMHRQPPKIMVELFKYNTDDRKYVNVPAARCDLSASHVPRFRITVQVARMCSSLSGKK